MGVPYQPFSVSGVAPAGTTQAKVEFANNAGYGSAWFDNAELTVIPEPASMTLLGMGALLGLLVRRNLRT